MVETSRENNFWIWSLIKYFRLDWLQKGISGYYNLDFTRQRLHGKISIWHILPLCLCNYIAGSMSNKYSNSSEDTVIGKFSLVSKK